MVLRIIRQFGRIIFHTPLHKLAITVAVGGAVVQSFGLFVRSTVENKIMYNDYFREAVAMTKEHRGTEYLFGKPMNLKALDADNKKRQCSLEYIPLTSNLHSSKYNLYSFALYRAWSGF